MEWTEQPNTGAIHEHKGLCGGYETGSPPTKGLHGNQRLSSQGGHSFFTHLTPSSLLLGIPVPFLVSRFLHVLLAAP